MFREPTYASAQWVSVLDDFLDLMSNFDPISPALTLIQDALNGPSVDFAVSAYAGWTKGDIRRLLSKHGVKTWGFDLSGWGGVSCGLCLLLRERGPGPRRAV